MEYEWVCARLGIFPCFPSGVIFQAMRPRLHIVDKPNVRVKDNAICVEEHVCEKTLVVDGFPPFVNIRKVSEQRTQRRHVRNVHARTEVSVPRLCSGVLFHESCIRPAIHFGSKESTLAAPVHDIKVPCYDVVTPPCDENVVSIHIHGNVIFWQCRKEISRSFQFHSEPESVSDRNIDMQDFKAYSVYLSSASEFLNIWMSDVCHNSEHMKVWLGRATVSSYSKTQHH